MAQVIQLWRQEKRERGVLVVEEKRGESKEEKTLNMEISAMIGIGLYQLQFANNDELDITRRKMVGLVDVSLHVSAVFPPPTSVLIVGQIAFSI